MYKDTLDQILYSLVSHSLCSTRLEGISGKDRVTSVGAVDSSDAQEQVYEEDEDHSPDVDDFGMSANPSFDEGQGAVSY
ncbi:hypothetical protein S83_001306 [Arachis hypogaea]